MRSQHAFTACQDCSRVDPACRAGSKGKAGPTQPQAQPLPPAALARLTAVHSTAAGPGGPEGRRGLESILTRAAVGMLRTACPKVLWPAPQVVAEPHASNGAADSTRAMLWQDAGGPAAARPHEPFAPPQNQLTGRRSAGSMRSGREVAASTTTPCEKKDRGKQQLHYAAPPRRPHKYMQVTTTSQPYHNNITTKQPTTTS
jgi:hypothetical protein